MEHKIEYKASRVIKKLRQSGCGIIAAIKTRRGVVIHIEKPTTEMTLRAIEIRQQYQGISSTVYTLQVEGCIVNWTQGGAR